MCAIYSDSTHLFAQALVDEETQAMDLADLPMGMVSIELRHGQELPVAVAERVTHDVVEIV